MRNNGGVGSPSARSGFGTAPVYFTAISTILGAILFLRFGYAIGTLGFWGVLLIVILGHLVTIPTALALSEIATNTRVEGGGEYFIISRSFGLKIGATIGLTLYLSQAISIAFYVIAFAEAFEPLFAWWHDQTGYALPRQAITLPTLGLLALAILHKGAGLGAKMLYVVNVVLFIALLFFFAGQPIGAATNGVAPSGNFGFFNADKLFVWFAICFPAFTGMTAGVGLSGNLKNPGKSIPLGTIGATLTGLAVYILVVWKLSVSASQADLLEDQLIMSRIACFGSAVIPAGLAACTFSSALGSIMVAPRTLQALALDHSFPLPRINRFLSQGRGDTGGEPYNASVASLLLALVFILLGSIDEVAAIISMFFLITYGTLCLISFINHFGSPPSYRPRFKSKWYLSLGGFLFAIWLMFKIHPLYTIASYATIALIYLVIEHYNKEEKGLTDIFEGALFQLNRRLRVFMQKHKSSTGSEEWRPSAICISPNSFEREKPLELMKWISQRHGFGTYFHYIPGYYSRQTYLQSQKVLRQLVNQQKEDHSALYIDTMISPSYTSALAQVIQAPSISGMENNMVLFEYDQSRHEEIARILDNINLAKAGDFDICILAASTHPLRHKTDIHVWIRDNDEKNINLMILLGYIIIAHPHWSNGSIKIFIASQRASAAVKDDIQQRIAQGRLPITLTNIEIVTLSRNQPISDAVEQHSKEAGLTLIGFNDHIVADRDLAFFSDFHCVGDLLFVHASRRKEID